MELNKTLLGQVKSLPEHITEAPGVSEDRQGQMELWGGGALKDLREASPFVFQYLINLHSPTAAVSALLVNANTPSTFSFNHSFPLPPPPPLSLSPILFLSI